MERRVEADYETTKLLEDGPKKSSWNQKQGLEEEEAPFDLPASEVVYRSHRNSAIAVFVLLLACAAMAFAPSGAVVDPVGCLACGYIFFLFCFQNTFIEWPVVPAHILLLLVSALASLLGPTGMKAASLPLGIEWRCLVWLFDAGVIAAGYRFMVRGPAPRALEDESLEGKTFVITGCNTGIGYETASTLARAGATIVFACRSEDRARAAMEKLVEDADGDVEEDQLHFIPLDTSNFASVRNFADLLQKSGLKPHTLILNAGVMLRSRGVSTDGYEMTMATNHFGHHLLVQLLLPSLLEAERRGEQPRIVLVGSNMCYMHGQFDFGELGLVGQDDATKKAYLAKPYELFRAYGQSKLANLHFTTELARRLRKQGSKIPVNEVHPGEVLTEVMRDMHPVVLRLYEIFKPLAYGFLKSPSQGSFCTLYAATDKDMATADAGISGAHFVRLAPAPLSKAGSDKAAAKRLWEISDMVTGGNPDLLLEGEEEEEAPFDLPASEVVYRSHRNSAIAVFVLLLACAAMAFAPSGAVVDPVGCLACGYIFFLFCFQNTFIEWPVVPAHILLLLVSALASLLGPTGMKAASLPLGIEWRCLVWLFDAGVIAAGYRFMVRGPAPRALEDESLEGKTFVITGCNTGIGYETASTLARAGATIVFACRSEDRARAAMEKLVEDADGDVEEDQLHFIPLDTSNFASVRNFADLLQKSGLKPHTLILNAGVMLRSRGVSTDGYEMTMATNHFGHHLLVQLLLPSLLEAEHRGEQPRIVLVGSNMCYMHGQFDFGELGLVGQDDATKKAYLAKPYELFRSYGQSKLANLHFTTELARRLRKQGSKIPVNEVHPGEVLTEVMRDMHPVVLRLYEIFKPLAYGFLKSPSQGSFCTLYAATDKDMATADAGISGAHFVRLAPAPLSKAGSDKTAAKRLWEISERVTGEASMA